MLSKILWRKALCLYDVFSAIIHGLAVEVSHSNECGFAYFFCFCIYIYIFFAYPQFCSMVVRIVFRTLSNIYDGVFCKNS